MATAWISLFLKWIKVKILLFLLFGQWEWAAGRDAMSQWALIIKNWSKDVILSCVFPLVGKAISVAVADLVSSGHVEKLNSSSTLILNQRRISLGLYGDYHYSAGQLVCFCLQFWKFSLYIWKKQWIHWGAQYSKDWQWVAVVV